MIIQSRRKFLTGLVGLVAAPAVVKAASLMPIKSFVNHETALAESFRFMKEDVMASTMEALLNERLMEARVEMVKHMSRALYTGNMYDTNTVADSIANSLGWASIAKELTIPEYRPQLGHVEIAYPIKIVRG